MWHTDLHMGNIFVSEQDHSQIVCLIDWQSTSISPLFLQARWPEFLTPPDDYVRGPVCPALPPKFEELDPDEKKMALSEKRRADGSKAYEIATYLNNRDAYAAGWEGKEQVREIFKRIGDTWDDGIVPLHTCLAKICDTWGQLGSPEPCPLQFPLSEIDTFNQRSTDYKQWYEVQDIAKQYLDTDAEGWVAPQLDFTEKVGQNRALLNLLVERADSQEEADVLKCAWPFPT
ncbi:MAG: hypothetical protein Q9166_008166 [cf. Caloplaca sp. 2 TL-2023]